MTTTIEPATNNSKYTKYRNRQEIIYQILSCIDELNGTATITKIMFASMTAYVQLKEYMDNLIRSELVTYDKKTKLYAIAEKGRRYIEIYSVLCEHLGNDY